MAKFSIDRRRFAIGAAAAATTAIISPGEALEQAQTTPPPKPPEAHDAKTSAAMAKLSPAAQAEVEMKVASIFRKYGNRLSNEQKADIQRAMAESQDGLEKMRAFVLENGDEPATVLKLHLGGKE
ncbi:MAG TPA: hypothetical protein VFP59_11690 [Candidatus Angelobacter sp.]|nr:hypothetical protein [Candidatus Angelobacter sp.]